MDKFFYRILIMSFRSVGSGTLQQMAKSAYKKETRNIDGWQYIEGNEWVKMYGRGDEIIVATRGSQSSEDWTDANRRIPFNQLESSTVYQRNEDFIKRFKSGNPQYKKYYGVGHSLSGAINDIYLRKGLVSDAVSFNPAVETQYFNKNVPTHRRIYMSDDPLYNIMGRRLNQRPEVRPSKKSWGIWLSRFTPVSGLVGSAYHSLESHDIDRFAESKSVQQMHGGNNFIRVPKGTHKLPTNLLSNL